MSLKSSEQLPRHEGMTSQRRQSLEPGTEMDSEVEDQKKPSTSAEGTHLSETEIY